MDYTFVREGKPEKVELERWAWGVIYQDGTELHQFDSSTGLFHQFGEIDMERVDMFTMYKTECVHPANTSDHYCGRIDIPMHKGMQVFHFYRNMMLDQGGDAARHVKVYVFGWKRDGVASYNYILPDDRIITADRDIAGLPNYNI